MRKYYHYGTVRYWYGTTIPHRRVFELLDRKIMRVYCAINFSTYFLRRISNSISGKCEYPTFVHSLWRFLLLLLLLSLSFFRYALSSTILYVDETIFLTEGTNQNLVKNKTILHLSLKLFVVTYVRKYRKVYRNLCEVLIVRWL